MLQKVQQRLVLLSRYLHQQRPSVNDDGSKISVPIYVNDLGVEDKKNNKPFKTHQVLLLIMM